MVLGGDFLEQLPRVSGWIMNKPEVDSMGKGGKPIRGNALEGNSGNDLSRSRGIYTDEKRGFGLSSALFC